MTFLVAWLLALSLIFLGPKSFGALDTRLSAFLGAGLALAVAGCVLGAALSYDSYYQQSVWHRFGSGERGLSAGTIALDVGAAILLAGLGVSRARRSVGAIIAGAGLLSMPCCLFLLLIAMVGH